MFLQTTVKIADREKSEPFDESFLHGIWSTYS